MKQYLQMTADELKAELNAVDNEYNAFAAKGLSLNMARGKPGPDQLDHSSALLTIVGDKNDVFSENKVDCRNYGGLDGLDE